MRKIFRVTDEMIRQQARGDPDNSPVVIGLKQDAFPEARDIIVHEDEVWIDNEMWELCVEGLRFLNAWNKGKRVSPMTLQVSQLI